MSQHRISPRAGWVNRDTAPRGPNGRLPCRWCATECPGTRARTFCSAACVHEWKIRTQPAYARRAVAERDMGICALCGVATVPLLDPHPGLVHQVDRAGSSWQADHIVPVVEGGGECGLDGLWTLCTACHKRETAALAKRRAEDRRRVVAERRTA